MAKAIVVSEDDLLRGAGGFDAFNRLGNGKPIRDNPFRDTRARPESAIQTNSPVQSPVETSPSVMQATNRLSHSSAQTTAPKIKTGIIGQTSESDTHPTKVLTEGEKRNLKKDKFPEKVTTFITTKMRDDLLIESRKLNARRLVKGDPLTSNTLIRCGIRVITEMIEFLESDLVSSEEELYALVKRKLGR